MFVYLQTDLTMKELSDYVSTVCICGENYHHLWDFYQQDGSNVIYMIGKLSTYDKLFFDMDQHLLIKIKERFPNHKFCIYISDTDI
jgi:hypothetical protein